MRRRAVCSPVLPFVAGLGVPKFSDDATPAKPLPPRRLHRWKASFWSSPAACKGHEGSQALSRKHSDDPSHVLQWHRTRGGFVHESIQATQLPGLGWALCARADIGKDAVLVTTPAKLLWVARECHAPAGVHPLAPGEELPGASMLLRRRLVDAVAKPSPFVKAMQPPGSIPLQLAAGSLADGPPESLTSALKGTSLLRHTLSLRTKLLEAVGPELQSADDPQHLWELSVWAQSVIMSRAFKIPKGSDRLVLIPIVDIANHAATHKVANADVRNNADGSISMVAVRDIAQGEEVRICYGEYTNEQLLFCYGFVIPDNPCQGLVCPLQFPDSPKRSELLHHCLAHRRQLVQHPLPAKAGPLLYRANGTVSFELLLALKVTNITEIQAEELLEAKSWESSVLDPRPQELVQCLAFLEAWQRELSGRDAAVQAEDFEACVQLQDDGF
eukprot:s2350_g3.t2